jgi:phage terminase large subunit GpA-like protein
MAYPRAVEILRKVVPLWAPPPRLSLSDWSDEYRRTSSEASAEVGKWRTRPYQKEPLDAFTDNKVHAVVIMSAIQMLKTEFILNALGYVIHLNPGPVLVVQFRDTDCEVFSKIRLAPMLRDTPVLRGLVSDSKGKSSGNTITHKTFPGGHLRIAASASPGNLAALPVRYLFCDEVDKYPASAGPEGDPITLAEGRMEEFEGISKEILTCSPTIAGKSRIEKAYLESDQRIYEVPCQHCGHFQELKWSQVRIDETLPTVEKQAKSARYECENADCKAQWDDADRWKAVNAGRYRATAPFNGVAGFRISALNSLKKKLSKYALQQLRAKGDTERLKAFRNTVLAETWVEQGEAPDWEILLTRLEDYTPGIAPRGVILVTAGIDVQRDRIEVEIVGWGRGYESWSLGYHILEGRASEPEVWKKLEALLRESIQTETGAEIPISRVFIDSGDGTTTNDVYTWVRTQPASVVAIKGVDRGFLPVGQPSPVDVTVGGRKVKSGLKIRTVLSSFFKEGIYADLKKRQPTAEELAQGWKYPAGYCHFPTGHNYGDEHFKQLTAEQFVTRKDPRGRAKTEWQQTRPRNEALDCRVYAKAAAWDCGIYRFKEKHWDAMEARMKPLDTAVVNPGPKPIAQLLGAQPTKRKMQVRLL